MGRWVHGGRCLNLSLGISGAHGALKSQRDLEQLHGDLVRRLSWKGGRKKEAGTALLGSHSRADARGTLRASLAAVFGAQKGRWKPKEGGRIAVPSGGHEGTGHWVSPRYNYFYCPFLPTLHPH